VFELGPPGVDKPLGGLGVVARFCDRLGIAEVVDEVCPVRDVARVSHGQVIEALVANRLTSPTPMLHVQDWARLWAVPETFGVPADALNDDRIARALDAVAPEMAGIVGSLGARAISRFGVDVARMHWDMTSISVYGAYPEGEEGYAQPRFGHPKDRRPDLKQVQAGIGVSGDGGIPLYWRSFDGGAAEVSQVVGAMTALRELAGPRRFLLVGDSKLVSYPNLAALVDAGVGFVAPLSKTYLPAAVLAALDPRRATPVDYVAERDADKPPEDRGGWAVLEDTVTLPPPKGRKGTALPLRRVFVHSTARAAAAATARTKKLDRARGDLDRLTRGLGGRYYPNVDTVTARVAQISAQRHVGSYLHTDIAADPAGKPTLTWRFDAAAVAAETATDGWYALVTNLPAAAADAAEILRRYKGQEVVERRYHNFKGPLAVAPLFLHTPRRIDALINIICIALLIFSLIERELRRAIAPETKLDGLYAGRPAKPTGRLIFTALATLRLHPATPTTPAYIPQPTPLQARILHHLHATTGPSP
jgi:transposase